jgi:hypothetical protein
MKKYLARTFALLVGAWVIAVATFPQPTEGQSVAPSQIAATSFTWTTANVGQTVILPLNGQAYCSLQTNVGSLYSGATLTVQGYNDPIRTGGPVNAPYGVASIGVNGVVTNPVAGQSYSGSVAPWAVTYVGVTLTALASGTVAGSLTCTTAIQGGPYPLITPVSLATASAYVTLSATTWFELHNITAYWNAPSAGGVGYLYVYNVPSPAPSTASIWGPVPINMATPGSVALPFSVTEGNAPGGSGLSVACYTTPTSSTTCNSSAAAELWVEGY